MARVERELPIAAQQWVRRSADRPRAITARSQGGVRGRRLRPSNRPTRLSCAHGFLAVRVFDHFHLARKHWTRHPFDDGLVAAACDSVAPDSLSFCTWRQRQAERASQHAGGFHHLGCMGVGHVFEPLAKRHDHLFERVLQRWCGRNAAVRQGVGRYRARDNRRWPAYQLSGGSGIADVDHRGQHWGHLVLRLALRLARVQPEPTICRRPRVVVVAKVVAGGEKRGAGASQGSRRDRQSVKEHVSGQHEP